MLVHIRNMHVYALHSQIARLKILYLIKTLYNMTVIKFMVSPSSWTTLVFFYNWKCLIASGMYIVKCKRGLA